MIVGGSTAPESGKVSSTANGTCSAGGSRPSGGANTPTTRRRVAPITSSRPTAEDASDASVRATEDDTTVTPASVPASAVPSVRPAATGGAGVGPNRRTPVIVAARAAPSAPRQRATPRPASVTPTPGPPAAAIAAASAAPRRTIWARATRTPSI